jgi:hypothetical protein
MTADHIAYLMPRRSGHRLAGWAAGTPITIPICIISQ